MFPACLRVSRSRVNGIEVKDPKKFLDSLLPYMMKQQAIEERTEDKKVVYVYRK